MYIINQLPVSSHIDHVVEHTGPSQHLPPGQRAIIFFMKTQYFVLFTKFCKYIQQQQKAFYLDFLPWPADDAI